MLPPFPPPHYTNCNLQRAKNNNPSSTPYIPSINFAQLGPSDNEYHERISRPYIFHQGLCAQADKEARLRDDYLRAQHGAIVRRERERTNSELSRRLQPIQQRGGIPTRRTTDSNTRYNLAHRQRQHQRYPDQQRARQQQLQGPQRIKRESPENEIILKFARKIQDRFPGKPQLARRFLSMMGSNRPAEDFLPDISESLRRAPELVSEYQASMSAFDQSRAEQPKRLAQSQQPHQSRPAQPQPDKPQGSLGPPYSALPPTPYSGNGDDHDEDDEVDDNEEEDEAPQEQEQHAVQHLLQLPEIDIPPEQRKATPVAMSCTLMDHQKVCLTWLMDQEDDRNKRGGILADTMGLGKTVQSLALILAHPSADPACKTTLIVAPLALLKQWEREIQSKVKPAYALKTLLYHGSEKRGVTVPKLLTYDVVLTTYGTIAWEYKAIDEGKKNKQPIILSEDTVFHRAILDEAHHIKNRQGKSSLGTSLIKANYRLCMTGTPFMNKVKEIYPLIRFLQIKPYNEWTKFSWDINRPIENWGGDAGDRAMRMLQALFRSITLRRTKGSVLDGKPILRLPPIHKHDVVTKFNEDEQAFYTALERKQQLEVNRFLKNGMLMRQYTYILVLLLRLRQACCHPHLIRDFGIPEGIQVSSDDMCKLASKLKKGIVEKLKGQEEFVCPLCQSTTKNPLLVYPCGHPVCNGCFSAMTEVKRPDAQEQFTCPHGGCNVKLTADKVICYCFFLEIHMPKKLEADDSDDSGDEWDDSDDDDIDDEGNLKDFIVSGSEDEYDDDDQDEEEEELELDDEQGDADESDHSENDDYVPKDAESRQPSESKDGIKDETVKGEECEEKKSGDVSDSDSLESLNKYFQKRRIGSTKTAKASREKSNKRKDASDSDSDEEWKPSRSNGKRKRSGESLGSRKKSKRDGAAGKKRQGRKSKFISLAALKKAGSTNAAAKEKYIRKLRKDWVPSAKIDKTMEILRTIRDKNPMEKTLIFSLWTSFLDLLEIPVIDQEFKYVRYDGSMSSKARDQAVKTFMDVPDIQVMLVSLSAGNAGLNLTAATNVIIIEPFWNPFVEEQAIDRTHRIGQNNAVTVHRVLIEGTVEDRIRELQDKKRTLVNAALSEEGAQGVGKLTLAELKGLFGIH